jgi:hypothetical protein
MKGYGAISALNVFKFWLSLGKGGRIEANLLKTFLVKVKLDKV